MPWSPRLLPIAALLALAPAVVGCAGRATDGDATSHLVTTRGTRRIARLAA